MDGDMRPEMGQETPFGRAAPVTLQDLIDNEGYSPQAKAAGGKNPEKPMVTMGSRGSETTVSVAEERGER